MSKMLGEKLLDRYRVTDGAKFRLKDHDPADLGGLDMEDAEAEALMQKGVARLSELQTWLYADDRWSMLAVFQAMDAAGKDGTIKHVMTGVNPQGVLVTSFKHPGLEDLAHGFLWRIHKAAPSRGHVSIFNRSHYEDVLIARVHPELLEKLRLPEACRAGKFWKHRFEDIAAFEAYLAHQGTIVLKFFLNVSKAEQKRRFLSRIDEPAKNWKFSAADLKEREYWDDYMDAYEAAIIATATREAPWYVVPADHKWFTHLVVVSALVEALENLDLREPSPPAEEIKLLRVARARLEAE